jgi:hypothetical protein
MLRVAEKLLAAKIALVKGDKKSAYELFTKAVQAEDATSYAEPPIGICRFVKCLGSTIA